MSYDDFDFVRLDLQLASLSWRRIAGYRKATKAEKDRAWRRLEKERKRFKELTGENPEYWESYRADKKC